MKVGIVWNHPSTLGECSFRFESYLAGLETLGHEGIVVCAAVSDGGLEVPRVIAKDARDLEDNRFWQSHALDVAVVVTWHRMSSVLKALQAAGARVVAIGDSDGQLGFWDQPLATWTRLMVDSESPRMWVRGARFWLREWRRSLLRRSERDRETLASTQSSDVVVLGHTHGRQHLSRFLRRRGAAELARRLRVVPFAVAAPFTAVEVAKERDDQVVVVGRWRDPQKDPGLVASVLERFLSERSDATVLIVGEGEEHLGDLARRHPRAQHAGFLTFDELAHRLARSRILFSASRWEGAPHSALEALATGMTLVGPPIPCFLSWARDEGFGTVARRRDRPRLLRALLAEEERWERGERVPLAIAAQWRRRLDPARLCAEMLA